MGVIGRWDNSSGGGRGGILLGAVARLLDQSGNVRALVDTWQPRV